MAIRQKETRQLQWRGRVWRSVLVDDRGDRLVHPGKGLEQGAEISVRHRAGIMLAGDIADGESPVGRASGFCIPFREPAQPRCASTKGLR